MIKRTRVRISDSVLDDEDWPIWELEWEWSEARQCPVVGVQRACHHGAYCQGFTGMSPEDLAAWASYDGTGTHPEFFHDVWLCDGRWSDGRRTRVDDIQLDSALMARLQAQTRK